MCYSIPLIVILQPVKVDSVENVTECFLDILIQKAALKNSQTSATFDNFGIHSDFPPNLPMIETFARKNL